MAAAVTARRMPDLARTARVVFADPGMVADRSRLAVPAPLVDARLSCGRAGRVPCVPPVRLERTLRGF